MFNIFGSLLAVLIFFTLPAMTDKAFLLALCVLHVHSSTSFILPSGGWIFSPFNSKLISNRYIDLSTQEGKKEAEMENRQDSPTSTFHGGYTVGLCKDIFPELPLLLSYTEWKSPIKLQKFTHKVLAALFLCKAAIYKLCRKAKRAPVKPFSYPMRSVAMVTQLL